MYILFYYLWRILRFLLLIYYFNSAMWWRILLFWYNNTFNQFSWSLQILSRIIVRDSTIFSHVKPTWIDCLAYFILKISQIFIYFIFLNMIAFKIFLWWIWRVCTKRIKNIFFLYFVILFYGISWTWNWYISHRAYLLKFSLLFKQWKS